MNKIISLGIILFLGLSVYGQKPISDEILKKIFPTKVSNYPQKGDLDGITLTIAGTEFSNATATYEKGKVVIEIMIIDYADSKDMFESSSLNTTEELNYESGGTFAKTFTIDGKRGYVMGEKSANVTTMILVWNERFVLNVRVNGKYDETFVKAIYSQLDLTFLE